MLQRQSKVKQEWLELKAFFKTFRRAAQGEGWW
jgi:hypothetical protein